MIVQATDAAAPGVQTSPWGAPAALPGAKPSTNGRAVTMNGVTGTHGAASADTAPELYTNSAHVLPARDATLLSVFLGLHDQLEAHKTGQPVRVDGYSLSIADVVAAGRYGAPVVLSDARGERAKVEKSERAIQNKLDTGMSVYGISTGYGGSADTRTHEYLALGKSLLQHQHAGVLPSDELLSQSQSRLPTPLPLSDPLASTSMPESWVRAAIAIRANSLIRGHSGVQWSAIAAMASLLNNNITPLVPLRGSISASGDLQPLSYVAGALIGNPGIRVFSGPQGPERRIVSAPAALAAHGLQPHVFSAKDHLGMLNGTAFSAAVASLALYDASHLTLLAQVCTAMGTEALKGVQASHHPFIHEVTRPHPGQVEAARNMWRLLEGSRLAVAGEEKELTIEQDRGSLRQDRYALRTSPQFLGPQIEDILAAFISVTQECNSTTDNPLVDGETGSVHHGGNFQAMAVTNAMEKTRLALHHVGKLMFSQSTEVLNPLLNRGLPPNLAGTDPSVDYHCKGLDIATAAYVSELGFLANPVSTHIQSAELHNQAVNSLALVSARKTVEALDVLSMLLASYLYVLCQALDLRAQQFHLAASMRALLSAALHASFGKAVHDDLLEPLFALVSDKFDATSTMDAAARMAAIFAHTTAPLVDYFLAHNALASIARIPAFRASLARDSLAAYTALREQFLTAAADTDCPSAPASPWLARGTRPMYEFVRLALGVRHHGRDNWRMFERGFEGGTIGQGVSRIYEAIRDGRMHGVVAEIFRTE